MKNKFKLIKRLESIKSAIELEDNDIIELHIQKLQTENDENINKIIETIQNELNTTDGYSKICKVIDDYVYGFKNASLTPHQQEIFDKITKEINNILKNYNEFELDKNNNFISLSGSAGVGKTFLTSKLIEYFIKQKYKILLTTPTHKSLSVAKYMLNNNNIQVDSRTLQSYLNIKLKEDYLKGTRKFTRQKNIFEIDLEKSLDILIVDESSMISNELLKFIEDNLKQNKLKSVLFIGDSYQLPPIDEGENGIVKLQKQFKLTKIVRQAKDSYIIRIANELKKSIKKKKYKSIDKIFDIAKYPELKIFYNETEFLKDFTSYSDWSKNIILSFTNQQVDEQNRFLRYQYWQKNGIFPEDAILKGEKLIFNESYKNKFTNSEIIEVIEAKKYIDNYIKIHYWQCKDKLGRSFLVVEPDDQLKFINYLNDISQKARIEKDTFERKKLWRHYFATKDTYADVKYTFASTIHKSQGSTYENVYINLPAIINLITKQNEALAYRLMYVAVTRASKDIKVLF